MTMNVKKHVVHYSNDTPRFHGLLIEDEVAHEMEVLVIVGHLAGQEVDRRFLMPYDGSKSASVCALFSIGTPACGRWIGNLGIHGHKDGLKEPLGDFMLKISRDLFQ